MSNTGNWDHSGYTELLNEEKLNNIPSKRQSGNKKNYIYKDNLSSN